MKHLLFLFLFFGVFAKTHGQQHYPIFTQNYANPFLINPSIITIDRRPEINAMLRQQWTGINNGPQTIQLDVQYPIDPRLSIGLNLYNDKTILLSSSGALATFGYKVRLTSRHILGFGLSGGFISNQIDLEEVPDLDLIDPVLLNSTNNFGFDGQFGMHYRNRNLILGVSLLKLVDNRPFKEGAIQNEKFDPFKDRAAILGYRLNVSPDLFLQPTFYYRAVYAGYEYYEGSLLVGYKNLITIGGGYRTDFGPHVMVRLRFKDFHAGYAYDFPSTRYGGSTGGSHEAQLKWQLKRTVANLEDLAKADTVKKTGTQEEVVQKVEEKQEEPEILAEEKPQVAEVEPVVTPQPPVNTPVERQEELPPVEEKREEVPQEEINGPTYDLVVGVFVRKFHADRYARQLSHDGLQTEVKHKTDTDYYYVTVPKYTTKIITLDRVLEIRSSTQFKDAWFERFE